jgi:hypothetical protein
LHVSGHVSPSRKHCIAEPDHFVQGNPLGLRGISQVF